MNFRHALLLTAVAVAVPSLGYAAAPPTPPPVAVFGGNATLAVTAVTANAALPVSTATYPVAALLNDGTSEIFANLGTSNSVTATTSNLPLPPGACVPMWIGNNTYVAAVTASGTSTLRVMQFNGSAPCGVAPASVTSVPATFIAASLTFPATIGTTSTPLYTGGTAIHRLIAYNNSSGNGAPSLWCHEDGTAAVAGTGIRIPPYGGSYLWASGLNVPPPCISDGGSSGSAAVAVSGSGG